MMHFHQKIHEYLLTYRKQYNPNFNFLVRQKSKKDDKNYPGGKLAHGIVFQGTDEYCFVGLVDKNGGNISTRSVGLMFEPSEEYFKFYLVIVFRKETNPDLIKFYKTLASKFENMEWDNRGTEAKLSICKFPQNDPSKLYQWLDDNYPKIRKLALETNIDKLIPDDKRFEKLQNNLKKKLEEATMPNESFHETKNKFEQSIFDNFINYLRKIVDEFSLNKGDERLVFSVRNDRLNFTIGQLYCLNIYHDDSRGVYSAISKDKLNTTSKAYQGSSPQPYLTFFKDVKHLDQNWESIKLALDEELNRTTKSSYRKYNDASFENYVFENSILNPSNEKLMKPALNTILFGPPGTGKTFKLQSEYFKNFTQYSFSTSKENYLKEQVESLAWWQVLYIALLDLNKAKVNDIFSHPSVQAKFKLSTITNLRASLWGALQRHTAVDCPNVNVVSRASIKPFWKTNDSEWHLQENEELDLFPEAKQILDTYHNYDSTKSKEIKNYTFVTFHQSFTYEDFVEGIKPVLENETEDIKYEISDGIFKKLALKAKDDPNNDYAIFIDEINRGNVASIFGELITLIEKDKRQGAENELSVLLPYSKTKFLVPSNLYIIGTMNTADRSIEALDSALRRRFEFQEVLPDYDLIDTKLDHKAFEGYKLSSLLKTINDRITVLIDRDHQIGHSYFLKLKDSKDLAKDLEALFMKNIIPLLQEYFFNDYVKIAMVVGEGFMDKGRYSHVKFASNAGDYESDYNDAVNYEIKKQVDIVQAIKELMHNTDA
jgi:hypothetical protein